jgi:hypothetical protein
VSHLAGLVVGLVLVMAGAAKLVSPFWPTQARELGAPRWSIRVVPWIELGLGALLLVDVGYPAVPLAAAALLVVFTGLLIVRLGQGRRPPCACFGGMSQRPIGVGAIVRNVVLIVLALVAALA